MTDERAVPDPIAGLEVEIAALAESHVAHDTGVGIPAELLRKADEPHRPTEADIRDMDTERQILRSCRAIFKNALFVAKNVTGDPTYDPADVDFDDAIEGICQKIVDRRRNRLAAERAASKGRAA